MTDTGIHVGDIGTTIIVTVSENNTPIDISGAISLNMKFKGPDSTVVTVPSVLYTDGTDGKIKYIHVTGDNLFFTAGKWQGQAVIQWQPSGVTTTYNSSTFEFTVYENVTG